MGGCKLADLTTGMIVRQLLLATKTACRLVRHRHSAWASHSERSEESRSDSFLHPSGRDSSLRSE